MPSDLLPALRAAIRQRRESIGLSVADAAERAGMVRPSWARLESADARDPSTETLGRIAGALGWRGSRLLREAEKLADAN